MFSVSATCVFVTGKPDYVSVLDYGGLLTFYMLVDFAIIEADFSTILGYQSFVSCLSSNGNNVFLPYDILPKSCI